jgi:hypothetical protein
MTFVRKVKKIGNNSLYIALLLPGNLTSEDLVISFILKLYILLEAEIKLDA